MNRAITVATAVAALLLLAGCTPRSERWEAQIEQWPEDVEMGGTPAEYREYDDGEDNFEQMMAADSEMAEH